MAAAQKILGTFEHTQGQTWGGTQIHPTVLKAVSVVGGFFGLDHLLLRSPRTAVMKTVVNIVSLGFWYFYDIVQLFSEPAAVAAGGLRIPVVGEVGLGAGILSGGAAAAAPASSPSPWRFAAYALLVWIPLGFANFVASDYTGGIAKFVLTFSPFFLFTFLWAIFSTYRTYFATPDLLTKGTERLFPITYALGKHGMATGIMEPAAAARAASQAGGSGIVGTVISWILSVFLPFLGPLKEPALKAVATTGKFGTSAFEGAKATVTTAANGPGPMNLLKSVTSAALPAAAVASAPPANNVLTNTAAAVASAAAPVKNVFANTNERVAFNPLPVQAGGAIDTVSSYLFIGLCAVTLLGAVGVAMSRFAAAPKEEVSKQTDTPPTA